VQFPKFIIRRGLGWQPGLISAVVIFACAYLLSAIPVIVCRRSEKRSGGNNEGDSSFVSCRRSFVDSGFVTH
jgi:hypothetical protein